jgi:Holliday junction resolvasome RuvABC endonuclease subunit
MFNASEILGKADVSGIERLAAGFGNLISAVTGVDARDAAMGNTSFHKAIYSALGLNYLDRSNVDVSQTREEALTAQYQARKTRIAGGGEGEAMSEQEWRQMVHQRKLRAAAPQKQEVDASGTVKGTTGGGERTAESEIDGNGDLILRVPGFRKDVAQANLDNLGEVG